MKQALTFPSRRRMRGVLAGGLIGVNLFAATPEAPVPLADRYAEVATAFDPLAPPLGLKTYLDLGVMSEENTLVQTGAFPAKAETAVSAEGASTGSWIYPLIDAGNLVMFGLGGTGGTETNGFSNSRTLWCSYSKDAGRSWTVPRFMLALVGADPASTIVEVAYRKTSGKTLRLTVRDRAGRVVEARFKENDLVRLATADDLRRAKPGRMVLRSVSPANTDDDLIASHVTVGGDLRFEAGDMFAGYRVDHTLGLLTHVAMEGNVLHVAQSASRTLYETRAVVTPKGDYLVMIPDGVHATSPRPDANQLKAYRSRDQGTTWTGPFIPFGEKEKHHAALPVVPRGSQRIYIFGTQRGAIAGPEPRAKAFGYRYSDDDGHRWSEIKVVRLRDGDLFPGTGVIQMTETESGTFMAGFHHARILRGTVDVDYLSWSLVSPENPAPETKYYGLDELRVIGLQAPEVLAVARSGDGHLWEMRSLNDGESWAGGRSLSLVQPDAPPMVFHLSDGKTLIALHHNRVVLRSVHEPIHSQKWKMPMPTAEQVSEGDTHRHSYQDWVSRAEIWFSLSTDGGRHWEEPRFLFANALAETLEGANPNYQCSYVDLFVDRSFIHLIIPHRWQRVVHLRFPEQKLREFATRADLALGTR